VRESERKREKERESERKKEKEIEIGERIRRKEKERERKRKRGDAFSSNKSLSETEYQLFATRGSKRCFSAKFSKNFFKFTLSFQ
jgi:hypothetical protein